MAPAGARRDAEQVRHAVLAEVPPVGEIDDGSLAQTEVGNSAAHVEIAVGVPAVSVSTAWRSLDCRRRRLGWKSSAPFGDRPEHVGASVVQLLSWSRPGHLEKRRRHDVGWLARPDEQRRVADLVDGWSRPLGTARLGILGRWRAAGGGGSRCAQWWRVGRCSPAATTVFLAADVRLRAKASAPPERPA